MTIEEIVKYLKCNMCGSALILHSRYKLLCKNCENTIAVVNNVPFFINTRPVIVPKKNNPRDELTWTNWRRKNYNYFSQAIQSMRGNALIIDLGAGSRPFSNLFQHYRTIAIDFYPYDGIDVICDLSVKIPFKSNFADCIISSNMLEHMYDPELTLRECNRILKAYGQLILTVPFCIKIHQAPYDFYRYTYFGLEYLLKRAGFKEINITPIGSYYDIVSQFNNALWRKLNLVENANLRILLRIVKKVDHYFTMYKLNLLKRGMGSRYNYPIHQGYGCIALKTD